MYIPNTEEGMEFHILCSWKKLLLHCFCNGEICRRVVELCVFSFSDDGFNWQVENFGKNKMTDYCDSDRLL